MGQCQFFNRYVNTGVDYTHVTQYDRLLTSYCRLSVCLSGAVCIVAITVGVEG